MSHFKWRAYRSFTADSEDGHDAYVDEMAMPARFYRIRVPDLGVILETGSGQESLALGIAEAVSEGMLGPAQHSTWCNLCDGTGWEPAGEDGEDIVRCEGCDGFGVVDIREGPE